MLFGSAAFGPVADWNQAEGILVFDLVEDMQVGQMYVVSFQLRNPFVAIQTQVPTLNATGAATIGSQMLVVPKGVPAGLPLAVAGDAAPLRVYGPGWAWKSLRQSTAFPRQINVLHVNLSALADMTSGFLVYQAQILPTLRVWLSPTIAEQSQSLEFWGTGCKLAS
jgi:hypothetical protein